jgi:hypothetical protein
VEVVRVTERPILFNSDMVRAILEGRKTQTRRPIKISFLPGYNPEWTGYKPVFENGCFFLAGSNGESATKKVKCPFGKVGDRLWVREAWQQFFEDEVPADRFKGQRGTMGIPAQPELKSYYYYRADGEFKHPEFGEAAWRPSIHMPKEAARIWLKVDEVRVERVREITEEDAKAEGIIDGGCTNCGNSSFPSSCGCDNPSPDFKDAFFYLWNNIYEKQGLGTIYNPWAWVVEFHRLEGDK